MEFAMLRRLLKRNLEQHERNNFLEMVKILAILIAIVVIAIIFLTDVSFANPSNCYSIQNQDKKNYCLAAAKNEKSYCYSIHENDTRNMCLAQLMNQKSYCYSINSNDTKNQCLAVVR